VRPRVGLSQNNVINTGYLVGNLAGITEEDIVLTTLNLHHANGLSLGLGMVLSHKCHLVVASELFSVNQIATSINEEFCTTLVCQPSEIEALLDINTNFDKISKIIISSSPLNLMSISCFEKLNSLRQSYRQILVTFGTNESSGVITVTTNPRSHLELGNALPHTQVSVVDSSYQVTKSDGTLAVKGFNVGTMIGTKDDQSTFIKNGELFTGLRTKMDSNGVISLKE